MLGLNTDQISICFYCLVKGERSEGVGGARPPEESEKAKQIGGRRSDRNLKPDSSSVCLSGGFQNKASWLAVTVFFFSFFSTMLRDRTASVQVWVICAARMRRWSQVQFVFFLYHRMCVRVLFCINAVSSVEGDFSGVLLKSQVQVTYLVLCCVCSDIPEDVKVTLEDWAFRIVSLIFFVYLLCLIGWIKNLLHDASCHCNSLSYIDCSKLSSLVVEPSSVSVVHGKDQCWYFCQQIIQ